MTHVLMPPETLWQRVLFHMIGTLSYVVSVLHSLEDEFTSEVFLVAVYQLDKPGQQRVGG